MRKQETEDVPVLYESIPAWRKRTGMATGAVYLRLKRGELRAIKVGRRTLIDVQHGLAFLEGEPWRPAGPVSRRRTKQTI